MENITEKGGKRKEAGGMRAISKLQLPQKPTEQETKSDRERGRAKREKDLKDTQNYA